MATPSNTVHSATDEAAPCVVGFGVVVVVVVVFVVASSVVGIVVVGIVTVVGL
jgi:hypothetical protein